MWATEWKMEDALEVRAREAWEDGLEKGLEKGKAEMARELLSLGVDVSIISQATKLSVDTILRLQSIRR
jgi:predicted transposase/invertase (TIGR01784 family)